MTIQFCPTCKRMQIIITKDSKQYLICKTCNTIEPTEKKERIIETEKFQKKQIGEGTAKPDFSGHHFKCQECGNDRCKIIDLGMMIGDEDWVYLLQCTKCDYSERIGEWC
jgi:DNA-directed RNA polymerase subunit M/transcription elongation factor TFIIS